MDGTGDGGSNGCRAAVARTLAGLAKKLMRHGSLILCAVLWCVPLATVVSAAVIELPSRAGAVFFDHDRHATREGTNCTVCHHTSTGTEVNAACRLCHRPVATSMLDSRAAFHGSCIACHDALRRSGQAAGPTKRCSGCHRQADVSGGAAPRP